MASHELEKGTLERIETRSDAATPNEKSNNPLEKINTNETLLAAVDIENHQAFKGDDSDGKVYWTIKKLLAAAFLSMLYTGKINKISLDILPPTADPPCQALRSRCTSPAAVFDLSRRTSKLQTLSAGYRLLTLWPLPPYALS